MQMYIFLFNEDTRVLNQLISGYKMLIFNTILGTREAAFVHAISSAGVAHAITLRCSSGALDDCGCDHSVKGRTAEGFQWSGCSHNIAYGVSLSKR